MGNKSGIVFSSCVEGNTGQMVSFSAFRTSILGFLPFQEFSRTSKFIQEIMVWSIRCFHIV